MTVESDQQLAQRVHSGDLEAFGELVRRYQQSVFNVCYRLLGERRAAEDLAQEAFWRAYQRFDTFHHDRPFGPWMRRVAANLCYNHLQNQAQSEVVWELDGETTWQPASPQPGPEGVLLQREASGLVRQALLALPAHYRVVIELRHFQELSYAEIAKALNLPLSDVKTHLFRARKQLTQILAQANLEP
jgi:RNA polymerase sigma-70 factor (ECF subfamily)